MKQPKKPTRTQRTMMKNNGLNWLEWAVIADVGSYLKIIKKDSIDTGSPKIKLIDKYRKNL